jgi:hypothetical protein
MNYQQIFDDYSAKMTQISLYQKAVQDLAKGELDKLNKYAEITKEKPELGDMESHNRMMFNRADDGCSQIYGSKKSSLNERMLAVHLHKNKQYQWLLAEAYEAFRDFLQNVYACAGYKDNNYWPLPDFGNITISELENKSFKWFQEKAKNKPSVNIRNWLRATFPTINKLEVDNALNINIRFAIDVIESLRHIVVHESGNVTDKKEFIKKTINKSGLSNNKKDDDNNEHVIFINSFFGKKNSVYENTIVLIEVPITDYGIPGHHRNTFKKLSDNLIAYAHLVLEEMTKPHNDEGGTGK